MGDKFVAGPGTMVPAQCTFCTHRIPGGKCTAFPERIPRAILLNEFDHRQPHEGDNGIQFEPRDDEAAQIVAGIFDTNTQE